MKSYILFILAGCVTAFADMEQRVNRAFASALCQQRHEAVEVLLDVGADVNEALVRVSRGCRYSKAALEFLLKAGANVNYRNKEGSTALIESLAGNADVVKILLEAGADVSILREDGYKALMIGSVRRDYKNGITFTNLDVWRLLLDAGWDVNATDRDGCTALIYALKTDADASLYDINLGYGTVYTEMAKFLVEAGADVNAKDDYGMTALMYASKGSNIIMMKLLMEAGADVNAKNNGGSMALGWALHAYEKRRCNNINAVKLLLDAGADANVAYTAPGGVKILALASLSDSGCTEAVEALLKAGADVNWTPRMSIGRPLEGALSKGHIEVVKLLLRAGAMVNAQHAKALLADPILKQYYTTQIQKQQNDL